MGCEHGNALTVENRRIPRGEVECHQALRGTMAAALSCAEYMYVAASEDRWFW